MAEQTTGLCMTCLKRTPASVLMEVHSRAGWIGMACSVECAAKAATDCPDKTKELRNYRWSDWLLWGLTKKG
jgi:hypothetical protein